jgi:hypothetical protein
MTEHLGDQPIEAAYAEKMNTLAKWLDDYFNGGRSKPKKVGFVLMVFDFGPAVGRCNYISNADRGDVVSLMREQIKRFEGAPDVSGTA